MINKKLCVELLGIGLPNRGAELMALTVMSKMREHFGDCIFCSSQKLPYAEKGRLDIYSCIEDRLLNASMKSGLLSVAGMLGYALMKISEKERLKYGIVLDTDVDIVLDISGFAYGDYWGVDKPRKRLTNRIAKWKSMKVPLFLLPQAFGPFETPGFKDVLEPVLQYAKLVCARDSISAAYLEPFSATVKTYPDITFSLPGMDLLFPPAASYSLVIPNSKLLKSNTIDKATYYEMVGKYVAISRAAGIVPFALNHEGSSDHALCLEIGERFGIPVLNPADARLIKQTIAGAEFVFSSRFHGAVSSIATNTPTLVLGWSHKYQQLMAQFGIEELLVGKDQKNLESVLKMLVDKERNKVLSAQISLRHEKVNVEIESFWKDFFVSAEASLPIKKLNLLHAKRAQ